MKDREEKRGRKRDVQTDQIIVKGECARRDKHLSKKGTAKRELRGVEGRTKFNAVKIEGKKRMKVQRARARASREISLSE